MKAWAPGLLQRMPPAIKRQALVQLFQATASAFQCDMPRLRALSREQCLLEYAQFTADRAGKALRGGKGLEELQGRLYSNAYRLGRMPGRLLHAGSVDDVMVLGRFLYGVLDIDFQGSGRGEITIDRCYFSDFYSPQICRLMSAMDRGLLTGLAGTGELVFTQRITEGQPSCRASFTLAAGPSSG
jgi:hypothetical protein